MGFQTMAVEGRERQLSVGGGIDSCGGLAGKQGLAEIFLIDFYSDAKATIRQAKRGSVIAGSSEILGCSKMRIEMEEFEPRWCGRW